MTVAVKDLHFLGAESRKTANITLHKYICVADCEKGTVKPSNTVNNQQHKLLRPNTYFSVACLLLTMPVSGICTVKSICPRIISPSSSKIIIKTAPTYLIKSTETVVHLENLSHSHDQEI